MMHQGEAIMDCAGEEKKNVELNEILDKFNEISIEFGN
jgi:putative ABC transport system ATP-binding protein